MSDNLLTRAQAIDRMRDGLPCETLVPHETNWRATLWSDFSFGGLQFRIPPEPRRVAVEAWCVVHVDESFTPWSSKEIAEKYAGTSGCKQDRVALFREVLPDEAPMRILGIDDARLSLHKAIHAIQFGNKTDDKLIIAQLADQGVYLARLLSENKS